MSIKAQFTRTAGRTLQFVLAGILVYLMGSPVCAEMRIWHTKDGSNYEAEFLREKPGKIFLRGADKQNFTVALTNLVVNDVKYLRTQILPDVSVRFTKTIREVERSDYASQVEHGMEVTGTVTIRKKSVARFDGQFPGEVYLIAKEVATDDYRLVAKKGFAVRFPDGSKEFEFEIKEVVINYEEYTTEMRGAFYEGYVVILFDHEGAPTVFDTNLSWLKETSIDALRKLPAPSFFDQMCRKRSVPRPMSDYAYGDFSY